MLKRIFKNKYLQYTGVILILILNISAFVFLFVKYEALRIENKNLSEKVSAAQEFIDNYEDIVAETRRIVELQNRCTGLVTTEQVADCDSVKEELNSAIERYKEKTNLNIESIKKVMFE